MKNLEKAFLILISILSISSTRPLTSKVEFENILDNFTFRLQEYVQNELDNPLIATGDWEKEYNPTSAGGSFYWKTIDGVRHRAVHIVGWLARFDGFGRDENELVLCHELGHHAYSGGQEREADYFITNICLPLLWQNQNHSEFFTAREVNQLSTKVKNFCNSRENPNYCYRAAIAFKTISNMRAWAWRTNNVPVNANTENDCRMSLLLLGMTGAEYADCRS